MPQRIYYQPVLSDGFEGGPGSAIQETDRASCRLQNIGIASLNRLIFIFSSFFASFLMIGAIWNWDVESAAQFGGSLAKTKNGTYFGRYDRVYDQYHFLGMPYAVPPVNGLRFRPPQPYNESWRDIRHATSYGPSCIGYRGHSSWYPQSEDCLSINVIAPAFSDSRTLLPVLIFVYGGGGHGGGSLDGRYNLTYLVSHAANHSKPFIGISFNYRSSIWGFIASREAQGTKNLNLGLRDQRLALHWVQENIASFGGDPRKVTIMGGSSGADDIGLQLIAYGGRDDSLFRAAILQSGSSVVAFGGNGFPTQPSYDRIISSTSCTDVEDSLECLRSIPVEKLDSSFDHANTTDVSLDMLSHSFPVIDGDFIQTYGSISLKESKFVKVPIIIGVSSNEGFTMISSSWKSWEDAARSAMIRSYPPTVIEKLLSFYPELPETQPLNPPIRGFTDLATYNRVEQLLGDLQYNAAKRLQCGEHSRYAACYSYRFDAIQTLETGNPYEGVLHGAEIAPVFQNFGGVGFEQDRNIFADRSPGFFEMSRLMGLMWAGFIVDLNPNSAFGTEQWPKYTLENPRNIVFNETGPYWVEPDTRRKDATDYINRIQHGVLHK